jgi:hypothetical protein
VEEEEEQNEGEGNKWGTIFKAKAVANHHQPTNHPSLSLSLSLSLFYTNNGEYLWIPLLSFFFFLSAFGFHPTVQ